MFQDIRTETCRIYQIILRYTNKTSSTHQILEHRLPPLADDHSSCQVPQDVGTGGLDGIQVTMATSTRRGIVKGFPAYQGILTVGIPRSLLEILLRNILAHIPRYTLQPEPTHPTT